MDTTTYRVNADRVEKLVADLSKITNRAAKLGVPTPTWSLSDLQTDTVKEDGPGGVPVTKVRRWYDLTLTSEPIKIAGYTFLATLDHTADTGVILRTAPNAKVPEQYREALPVCDHCKLNRVRKDTFVVQHESGTIAQVGRQCLHDFLGTDPTKFAKASEYALSILDRIGYEHGYWGDSSYKWFSTDEFLAATASAIRNDGWTSRAVAREYNKYATADQALDIVFTPTHWDTETITKYTPTAADIALAQTARAWAQTLREKDGLSDYEHNVAVVSTLDYIEHKHAGLAASIVIAYQKANNTAPTYTKRDTSKSQYVGTVGKREAFGTATVAFTFDNTRSYGGRECVGTLVIFDDANGNVLVWAASGEPDLKKGDVVTITNATVKDHTEYKGTKQTKITRVVFEKTTMEAA